MTNPMTDHIHQSVQKVMTDVGMLAKLDEVRDNICREFMTDEISDGLDEVIEALEARVEWQKQPVVLKFGGLQCPKCKELIFADEDKDHA